MLHARISKIAKGGRCICIFIATQFLAGCLARSSHDSRQSAMREVVTADGKRFEDLYLVYPERDSHLADIESGKSTLASYRLCFYKSRIKLSWLDKPSTTYRQALERHHNFKVIIPNELGKISDGGVPKSARLSPNPWFKIWPPVVWVV